MSQRICWQRIHSSAIPSDETGRAIQAFRHTSGAILTHRKLSSRHAKFYHRHGLWKLEHNGKRIALKSYYNQICRAVPLRWATSRLRQHYGPQYSILCGRAQPRLRHLHTSQN